VSARRLSEISRLHVSSVQFRGEPALRFSVSGGCSCEFLSDSAEFEAPVWALEPEHLPALAGAISLLGLEARPFTFLAHWLDSREPAETSKVKLSALLKDIVENRVRNNVLYLIG
jgi:hypothetical protein